MKQLKKIYYLVSLVIAAVAMAVLLGYMKLIGFMQNLVYRRYPQYVDVLTFDYTWDDAYKSYSFVSQAMEHSSCRLAELAR